jgi:Zn-dependent metalloprotease
MHRRILIFFLTVFFASQLTAQPGFKTSSTISSSDTGTGTLYFANRSEPPRAIEFNERRVKASDFLSNVNHHFKIPVDFVFTETESNSDDLGIKHHFLQEYYQGIALEGLGYRAHEKDGFMTSANGKAVRNIELDTQIQISEEQAFRLAVNYLQSTDTVFRNARKVIVSKGFTFTPESFAIAFQFDIDVSLIERWRISIDARNGQLINKVSLVNNCFTAKEKETTPPLPYGTGTGLTNYYGSKSVRVEKFGDASRLVGQTPNGGLIGTYDFQNVNILSLLLFFQYSKAYDFYSSDNTYNTPYQTAAVSAQWAAEQAYEYYFTQHNRNSFDNNGATIKSYVHVDVGLNNAFWTGKLLAFGDGSNNNPLVELDVVSHELTHGVTQYEARLQMYNESGALNESFSDILGKAVEFHTFGDTATWQLARHFQAGGLRDLSNPNLKNQPDTYQGDMWYTGYEDSGGVHTNSGIQNFWFYLLCEGGRGVNDQQASYSIESIGINKAAKIAYRNLSEYLSETSDYLDCRIGSLLATADLYGRHSTAYREVDEAWDAVGVIDEPIITSLELYDITATTVKIKGNFLPRAEDANYHFEYGTSPDLGSSSEEYEYTDAVEGMLTGLQSETKYYFRLVATNENGASYFNAEFTTISLAPLVRIKQTVDVTETTAALYGAVNPNSLASSFYFEYGTTPQFGLVTGSYPLPDTTEFLNVSVSVDNLQPQQTYYYRLVATNSFASAESDSSIFFTGEKPVITSYAPATAPPGTEITITGMNFSSVSEMNIVSFGPVRSLVLSCNTTEIKVKVPAGASFGTITVLNAESGLWAESITEFVPTFSGEFTKESLKRTVGISDIGVYKVFIEDMDGDNKPDIIGAHYQGFSIFQNVYQSGNITSESFIRNTYNLTDFSDLYVVDINGDGLKDIIGRYQYGIGLRIYPNESVPGYVFFGQPVDLPTGNLENLMFNDFDMDGHVDIAGSVTPFGEKSRLIIFRNQNPKGPLLAENFENRYQKILPFQIRNLNIGDLNNDGQPDLMTGLYDSRFFGIFKNNSRPGVFRFGDDTADDLTSGRFVQYTVSDLNADGLKDIISHSPYDIGNLAIFKNLGSSSGIVVAAPTVTLGDCAASIVQPGDINGDGKVDLLVGANQREFIILENNGFAGNNFSDSTFKYFEKYGTPIVNSGSGRVTTRMAINDLNGDGRPEVINAYSYNYGPHDGYFMEIWQNAPGTCVNPAEITVNASNYSATIILPAEMPLDTFEIEYSPAGATYWWSVSSTTLSNLYPGNNYQLRARAKCYLDFSDYYYLNFTTDCVDANSFSITSVEVNKISLYASNLDYFEIQYSIAGENKWNTLPQSATQISNLLPGTSYDLRFRGRCNVSAQFKYKKFTTLCPELSKIAITELHYNKAVVKWTSTYTGNAILEYSADSLTWISLDETNTMSPLTAVSTYYVRGKFACTDSTSNYTYVSFTTPCAKISTLNVEAMPFNARLNWEDESGTAIYTVTYSRPGGQVTTVETSLKSLDMDGLTPGTQYEVAVAPQCVIAQDFTSITFNSMCYVPFGLSADAITQTTTELSWQTEFNGVPYVVDYSILGSDVWLTTETSLTKIALAGLRPGTEYETRVHINCPSETPGFTLVRFKTNLYEETTLAPNPTHHEATIHPSKDLIGNHFSVQDNTGRVVVSGNLTDYVLDLSGLHAGIYLLKVDGERPMKIFKQ